MEKVKKDHRISKGEAVGMTKRYRQGKKKLIAPGYKHESVLPICETFDRSGFDQLLAQPGCAAVRAYYAMNEQDQIHLVFVGVDANGRDILTAASGEQTSMLNQTETATEDAVILDKSERCPTDCPESSELNS